MTTPENRQWLLTARPQGAVKTSDFTFTSQPIPSLQEGQILLRNLYLSADPTQRGWIERDTYMPAIQLGEVVRSFGAGRVEASRHPDFAPGDLVQGLVGWQDYVVLTPHSAVMLNKIAPGMPIPLALGLFGVTGLTAYVGLLFIGQPQPGQTVVVSGAAGATGYVVGQLAKLKGCRAIGIAGGASKCAWLVDEVGFSAAVDYKSENVAERLAALCPQGIDVYFDNVGGPLLDVALALLAERARVVICGAISGYNNLEGIQGPKNYLSLLIRRARMEGFVFSDHVQRIPEMLGDLSAWMAAGQVRNYVDIQEGLEHAPETLKRLFEGKNQGKQLLKIA